ncbi:AP2-associated kinase [Clonorchis sinensis]|uniref:non-specific serine/threonine protein kinase n=1 Tax=Clonorchis sinensis TaxID=79923 RepID=G7YUY2_CLOSI|nr:AP2-associated kinase [Clonorchis sinensis]
MQHFGAKNLIPLKGIRCSQKAFAVLRVIRRTFSRITRTDFQILYGAYVRPLLEYANPVVHSGRTKDVILIERVQRAATKMVAGLKSMDYETRPVVLDLFPLEYRRLRGDLILTYALFEQGLANRFFTVDPANTAGTRDHVLELYNNVVLTVAYMRPLKPSGGFGVVFRVRSQQGQYYALKRTCVNSAQNLAICKREITIVSSLSHKNILRSIDSRINRIQDGIFEVLLLTAYYPGSLSHLLSERQQHQQRLTEVEVLRIFCDLCEAVCRLHHCKTPIIHRDLKVENILIDERQNFVLCDFGSATSRVLHPAVHGLERCQEEINKYTTLAYRAPEMINLYSNVPLGPQIDIWALGCLLYCLCFTALPFGDSALAIQSGIYSIPDTSPYSERLHRLIGYLLQIDAAKRPDIFQVSALAFSLTARPNPAQNLNNLPVPHWQDLSIPPRESQLKALRTQPLVHEPTKRACHKTPVTWSQGASDEIRPLGFAFYASNPKVDEDELFGAAFDAIRKKPKQQSAVMPVQSAEGVRKTRTPRLAIEKLVDPEVKRNYQNQLVECLPDGTVSDINDHWEKISKALLKVGTSVCGTTQPTSFKHWISDRTVSLLETRRQIPPGRHHNSTRRIIRRQVKLSVRANREAWWTRKAEEMEDAKNAGNVRRLFHLIRSTGPRKPLVSETIRDQNGSLICNKAERLPRWAQYFEQQFSWPPATSNPESWPSTESWTSLSYFKFVVELIIGGILAMSTTPGVDFFPGEGLRDMRMPTPLRHLV